MTRTSLHLAAFGLLLAAAAPCLHAAERITLNSGFELDCIRRESVAPNRMRLYTNGENYMEVATSSIRSIAPIEIPQASAQAPVAPKPFVPSLQPLQQILANAGAQRNLDVELLASVVHAESAGNARAISRTGARGLMQLMPATATELGVRDSFVPEQNVNGGSAYLDTLLRRYHEDITLALAAYNAGPAAVDRYHGIPPYRETRLYVARVVREFNRRKLAQLTATKSNAHAVNQ